MLTRNLAVSSIMVTSVVSLLVVVEITGISTESSRALAMLDTAAELVWLTTVWGESLSSSPSDKIGSVGVSAKPQNKRKLLTKLSVKCVNPKALATTNNIIIILAEPKSTSQLSSYLVVIWFQSLIFVDYYFWLIFELKDHSRVTFVFMYFFWAKKLMSLLYTADCVFLFIVWKISIAVCHVPSRKKFWMMVLGVLLSSWLGSAVNDETFSPFNSSLKRTALAATGAAWR